jgi:hypothetical protein
MLTEQLDTTVALQHACELDMTDAEARLRSLLPNVPAKDSMVSETVLEYRRLVALRGLGSGIQPVAGSLLERLLSSEPRHGVVLSGEGGPSYEDVFGHDTPYVWRAQLDDLLESDPMPGGGAGSDNSQM